LYLVPVQTGIITSRYRYRHVS